MKTIFRLFALCLSLAACLSLYAETNKTLLRIDGNDISVDEFTYYFQRSAQKQGQTPEQYFPCFLDFKLKVAEAKRMKLDTLPDFQNQYKILQATLLKSLLTDAAQKNELYHSLYNQQASRLSLQDWVKMEIITLRLPQHATAAEEKRPGKQPTLSMLPSTEEHLFRISPHLFSKIKTDPQLATQITLTR